MIGVWGQKTKPFGRALRILAGGTALAMTLGACAGTARIPAPTPGATPLEISQSTNTALQEYLALIAPNKRGAFAVSVDGNNSYSYYCPEISCQSNLFGGIATSQCETLSGQECVLLYAAREPRIAYTVAVAKGDAGKHGERRGRPMDEVNVFGR